MFFFLKQLFHKHNANLKINDLIWWGIDVRLYNSIIIGFRILIDFCILKSIV